jgi:hypothetical protein
MAVLRSGSDWSFDAGCIGSKREPYSLTPHASSPLSTAGRTQYAEFECMRPDWFLSRFRMPEGRVAGACWILARLDVLPLA